MPTNGRDSENLAERRPADKRPVLVSALTGKGLDTLGAVIEARLAAGRVLIELVLEPLTAPA